MVKELLLCTFSPDSTDKTHDFVIFVTIALVSTLSVSWKEHSCSPSPPSSWWSAENGSSGEKIQHVRHIGHQTFSLTSKTQSDVSVEISKTSTNSQKITFASFPPHFQDEIIVLAKSCGKSCLPLPSSKSWPFYHLHNDNLNHQKTTTPLFAANHVRLRPHQNLGQHIIFTRTTPIITRKNEQPSPSS